MIVMKFGGTSVESAAAIERVAGIVRSRIDQRPVVVVSAMGKTTNKLLAIASAAIKGKREGYLAEIDELREMHLREGSAVVSLSDCAELEQIVESHFNDLTDTVKGLAMLGE